MAKIIADHLQTQLDVVLVRKIGSPLNPELAAGAVSEAGEVYLNPWAIRDGWSEEKLKQSIHREMDVIRQRRALFTGGRNGIPMEGRTVIVVDDGIATGATMIAAIHFLRQKKPKKIILAAGVIPPDQVAKFKPLCEEVVVLMEPEDFFAVGQFYRNFEQVSDEEVVRLLSHS